MGLDGFGITEEIFEKYWCQFFIFINPTFEATTDKDAKKFKEIFSLVRENSPTINNVK